MGEATSRVTYTGTNKPNLVAVVSGSLDNIRVRLMTVKDAAIEEIKAQPFYAPNVELTGTEGVRVEGTVMQQEK